MNRRLKLQEFDNLLSAYAKAVKEAEKMVDMKEAETELRTFVGGLIEELWKAHIELPRKDSKSWTVEFSTVKELNLTIKADLCKGYPGSRWEPPEPASVDHMEIEIEGCGITDTLYNKLITLYEEELDELVWEEAEALAEDMAQAEAEHRIEAAEHRRDLLEGR